MKSFDAYLNESLLTEAVADHAKALMATGNYDPAVRGNATKFKNDLKKTGATSSEMTAQVAWNNHKHLHPSSTAAAPKPVAKPAATPAPKSHAPGFEDARKVADHARSLGYNAKVKHDGHEHTVTLGWDWSKHRNAQKLEDHIQKHNLHHVALAADVSGAKVKTVY